MKAVTWQGLDRVGIEQVADPGLEDDGDILIRVTSTAICGSDLHLYHGHMVGLHRGDVIGHEPMGVVVEVGKAVTRVKKGDRVVIPFTVACGLCEFCAAGLESQCDNANPNGEAGGYFGYTDRFGGYAGGQAELLRVPFGNAMPLVIPERTELTDEEVLFLSDILPTAYWSVINSGMKPGDTVVVLGCGPVGLLTQKCAWLLGAGRVIALDCVEYRLDHAKRTNNVEVFDFSAEEETVSKIKELTNGGAHVVIDCVGMDGKMKLVERVETFLKLQGGALGAIEMAAQMVRKGGTVQLTGVYGTRYNAFPLGDFFARNVSLKMGQAPVIHLMPELLELVRKRELDATDIITHRLPLAEAAEAYRIFDRKEDGCIKVVLKP